MPKVQAAGGGGMGRGRRGRMVAATALAEINVVPLVDVMLVLLIIFMVAAPMMTRGLDVNLPVARRSQSLSNERIFVTIPLSFGKDRRVQLDEELIRVDVLGERMRQAMQGKSRQVRLPARGRRRHRPTDDDGDGCTEDGRRREGRPGLAPSGGAVTRPWPPLPRRTHWRAA